MVTRTSGVPMAHAQGARFACQNRDIVPRVIDRLTSPKGAAELPFFLDAITTNETYFDRDPSQYAWFQGSFLSAVLDAHRARRHPKRLRVWSAACSTGEEVYSLALRVHEERARFVGWTVEILGTDISGEVLATARGASYDARALRLVAPERRQRGFDYDPAAQRWAVKPEVRAIAHWKGGFGGNEYTVLQTFNGFA